MFKLSLRTLSALLFLIVLAGCAVPTAPAPASETESTQTRLIAHAMGETAVPVNPQRVVVLDSGELDAALALGVKPVGAVTFFEGDKFMFYLADQLEGVQAVGTVGEPNLEAIAALQPDLILSSKNRHEDIYAQLSAIAPTVFAETVGYVWRENFLLFAQALGKESEAQQVIADYETRLEEFQANMGDRLETEVSVIRVMQDGVRIIQRNMYIGVVLADAGLARPPAQDVDDRFQLVSFEQIPEMGGDVIFVSYYGQDDAALQKLLAQPLWQANETVAAGHAYPVNDETWHLGLGYLAAHHVLDDLESYLIGDAPAVPATEPITTTATLTTTEAVTASVANTETGSVTIQHEGGETTFDAAPQRVVALEYSYIDALQSLGLQPVAYADDGVPAYLVQGLTDAGAVAVGTRNEPSLEAISQLQPDLIIADLTRHSEIYDQLSQIAPTLLFDSYRGSYENQIAIFEQLSQVLRQEAAGQQVIDDALVALAEARTLTEGHARSVVIGVLHSGGFTAHSNASFKGSLLAELGLSTTLEPQAEEIQFLMDLEGLVTLAPEAFVITCAPEDNQILTDWVNAPVWQQLDAVKNQQVYVFNRDLWSKARGLLALHLVLRDAAESGLLTGEPSRSTVCPAPVLE